MPSLRLYRLLRKVCLCNYLAHKVEKPCKAFQQTDYDTVDDKQMGQVNQVGHLSKTHLNLLEIPEIGSVDTSESKQQNYHQI